MVLEAVVAADVAEKSPRAVFYLAVAMTIVSFLLVLSIFGEDLGAEGREIGGGYLGVAFVSLGMAPLFSNLFRLEELKDEMREGKSILSRHGSIIKIYSMLFLGVIVATSLINTLMPEEITRVTFGDQIAELNAIRGDATMMATARSSVNIFQNNLKVLALAFVFSIVFGIGAVFIITWNASIIGVLIGETAKSIGGDLFSAYIVSLPLTLVALFPHGIFEVLAYFIGGISGGIFSAALMRQKIEPRVFRQVLTDVFKMLVFSTLLLLIGAMIETGI